MKQLYTILITLTLAASGLAQDNALMFLKGVPQASQVNPAFRPVKGNYFSLPAIGSIKINGQNSGFSWSDLITKGSGLRADSLILNLDNLSNSLQDNNQLATEASLQILGFGFASGQSYFSFDMNLRFKAKLNYPSSLLDLRHGNWDYENDIPINHSTSDLHINGLNYTEIALGYNRYIGDRLTVGLRLKYLFGIASIESEKFNVGVETLENGYMRVYTDIDLQSSLPVTYQYDEEGYVNSMSFDENIDRGDFFTNKNQGWGLDLGLSYQASNSLTLSAAVNDLGYINWKTRSTRLYSNGEFTFDGMDISNEISGNESQNTEYWDELAEEFKNTFKVSEEEITYKTGLMASFNLSAEYQPKSWFSLGAISKSYILDGKWIPETTIAAGLNAGRALSTVFTYSMMKNAPANFGAGLMLKGGPLQLYCATDHINSLLDPHKAKYINARLGINLIF